MPTFTLRVCVPAPAGIFAPKGQLFPTCCGQEQGGTAVVAQQERILLPAQEMQVQSWGREDPWRRKWQPTPVFLPGEFHGQRSDY